jgi:outer membrane protein TolC
MTMINPSKQLRLIFLVCLALPFAATRAEARVFSLVEIETEVLAQNRDLQTVKKDQEIKRSELQFVEARFRPTLSGTAGFQSEKTADEDRAGPIAALEGNWNLYRGGQDQLARQKVEAEIGSLNFSIIAQQRSLLLEARNLFYSILSTEQKRRLLMEEIKINERQRTAARGRATAGVATRADELEFQFRAEELKAEVRTLEAQRAKDAVTLNALMNRNPKDPLEIKGEFPNPTVIDASKAIAKNPEILRLQNEIYVQSLETERINAEYRPEVNAFASLGKILPTQEIDRLESVVGLSVSVPIYDGNQRKSALHVVQLSKQRSELALEKQRNDTNALVESIQLERQEIDQLRILNERRLSFAEKYLRITLEEYERGVKNSPDVLGALEHVLNSKLKKIELALQAATLSAKAELLVDERPNNVNRSVK